MSDHDVQEQLPSTIIAFLVRWIAPLVMVTAYGMLMLTSDTDTTGKAWMTIGLAFVMVVWFLIRILTARAALSRAMAVGDADRILEITARELAKKRDSKARAPLLRARAFAFELRGEWTAVIKELDGVGGPEAAARRAGAYVELGQILAARTAIELLPAAPRVPPVQMDAMVAELDYALARGRVLAADKDVGARRELAAVASNIRATAWQRETAKRVLATLAPT